MERIGVDVYSIPPSPQMITSTFKIDTQRIGLEEGNSGQGKFTIHLVPNFLNVSALGHLAITVKDVLDHGIEGPSSAIISETPNTAVRKAGFIRKLRTIDRYKRLHYDEFSTR